jgi:glycosyltransferase involved in cell wall biosynthesis
MTRNVGVFHPGTQHSWQTARALQSAGRLGWYATSIFYRANHWPYRALPYLPEKVRERLTAEFGRFYHPSLAPDAVRTFGFHEWLERGFTRAGFRRLAARVNIAGNTAFAKSVCGLMAREPVGAVWGYDTSSADVFAFAKERGIVRILDKTIGDPRVYNALMKDIYAEYKPFFSSPNFALPQSIIDLQDREYTLADGIVVGSDFCRETILDPLARPDLAGKIDVLPYCYDDVFFQPGPPPPRPTNRPVRFLFLGQAGPRKGIHLLLKAFARLPRNAATLTIVGQMQVPAATFRQYADLVTLISTVPRSAVADYLRESDCLVFPTFFEGSPITIYEALACGCAIIQSKNSNLDAIPKAGLALERLDEDSVYAALMYAIDNRDVLQSWQQAAPAIAEGFTIAAYQKAVMGYLDKMLPVKG